MWRGAPAWPRPRACEFPQCCGHRPPPAPLTRVPPQCIPAARFRVFVLPTAITPGTSGRPAPHTGDAAVDGWAFLDNDRARAYKWRAGSPDEREARA